MRLEDASVDVNPHRFSGHVLDTRDLIVDEPALLWREIESVINQPISRFVVVLDCALRESLDSTVNCRPSDLGPKVRDKVDTTVF